MQFRNKAIQCRRMAIRFSSISSPDFSMLFRSGVVQFHGVSLPFLRLSELFPVQTTRRNSSARIIYAKPSLGKTKQFCAALFTSVASRRTTYLRCSVSGRFKAWPNYSMAFRSNANPYQGCATPLLVQSRSSCSLRIMAVLNHCRSGRRCLRHCQSKLFRSGSCQRYPLP